jgi:sugar phosphate isomerase/epimerase
LNDLNIFDINTRDELLHHLKKVIEYGLSQNIKIFVFGCPRNRKIINMNANNDEIFCQFFRDLGDFISDKDLKICIEPNSKQYGCNYINSIKEAGEIVKKINNKNIKMMIDIGNAMMENDDVNNIYHYKDIIYNADLSNEKMVELTTINKNHEDFINKLNKINYDRKINLEMILTNKEEELDHLRKSLYNFIHLFRLLKI